MTVVQYVSADSVDAGALIAELDVDLRARYPGIDFHTISLDELLAPTSYFVVARVDGAVAGCGALRQREPGLMEVKRMFVRPAFRRRGVARAVLEALEAQARAVGATRLVLETATGQPEAMALYPSAGYRAIPRYGEYVDIEPSRCYEKVLGD